MRWLMGLTFVLLFITAIPAEGQVDAARGASPYMQAGHWTWGAVRRLDALGLLPPEYAAGHGATTRQEMLALFGFATERAEAEQLDVAPLVRSYHASFCQEFRRDCKTESEADLQIHSSSLGAGYSATSGVLLTALGMPENPTAVPEPVEDMHTPFARADLAFGAWSVSGRVDAILEAEGLDLREGYLTAEVGPFGAWLGRRTLSLGYGTESLLLTGAVPLDGVGLESRALQLPWLLRYLGPVRISAGIAQLERVAPWDGPWLWHARATMDPHPRFRIGFNRAATVALVDTDTWTGAVRLLQGLVGKHPEHNGMDNQIASVELRYRPPVGPLPLSLYLEWGFEDSAGAWRDVPGAVWGAYLGAVPGLPLLGLGVERASFAGRCCGNPWWYRHGGFEGGWTDARAPLGHSLGGQGYEWRLIGDAIVGRTPLQAQLFQRQRYAENLYAPNRVGSSRGAEVDARFRPLPSLEANLSAGFEMGEDGWNEQRLLLGLAWSF